MSTRARERRCAAVFSVGDEEIVTYGNAINVALAEAAPPGATF
jgi:hypothetical protein